MTRIGLRALVLLPLGVVLIAFALWIWSTVPELTVENMDELVDDRSYVWLSRAPAIPSGLGLGCVISSLWLLWRQSRISVLRREHPSAIFIEVSVPKGARRELSSVFLSSASAWSYILQVREDSISLWAGLPPRPEIFIEATAVRAFEHEERLAHGRTTATQIVVEWNDGQTGRRLSLAPIGGGMLGQSAPAPALTAAAVQRGRELMGLEATRAD